MSPLVPRRPDLADLAGYHSAQVEAEVRLNTNESPFPPPEGWREELTAAMVRMEPNRYPDRDVSALREGLAELHGVRPEEVFCANGSNEALQSLLLSHGGPDRRALLFEPTYRLHAHISRITLTEVVAAPRGPDMRIDLEQAATALDRAQPAVTFVCSPNNPTGRSETPDVVRGIVERAPGLVVVYEAYGQFAPWSALALRSPSTPGPPRAPDTRGLVVVRTFSKTWAMAAFRLGYLIADPDVVDGCEAVTLPYHLSTLSQVAGLLALRYRPEMEIRVALITEERGRLEAALAELPVESWPSDANFILFRPQERRPKAVWADLVDRGVLIRDCSDWEGIPGCLRVTVGSPAENDRFLGALKECV